MATAASPPPIFPTDFYTGLQGVIATAPGAYRTKDALCCAKDAPSCSVVTQTMGADIYQQGSLNRSLQLGSAHGVVLAWGAPVNKVMQLQPGSAVNSSHAWACASACPMDGAFNSTIAIAPNHEKVHYLGRETVSQPDVAGGSTKSCDAWGWTEDVLKVLPVSNEVFYVDASTPAVVPFKHSSIFSKFITKVTHEASSTRNYSYIGFNASMDVASQFDVDMASVQSCKSDPDDPCPSTAAAAALARWHETRPLAERAMERAAERAAGTSLVESAAAAEAEAHSQVDARRGTLLPVFPPSYTTRKATSYRVAEGSSASGNGDTCCSLVEGTCTVQVQHGAATEYQDVEGMRTRTEDLVDGSVVVSDFVTHRTMLVDTSGAVDTCISYCPISSVVPRPAALTLPRGTVDRGSVVRDNQTLEEYVWSETVFGVVKVVTSHLYASVAANGSSAVPVFQSDSMFPFLGTLGTQNTTWSGFVPGRPPSTKFAIAGADTCEKAKHCKELSGAFHAHRLLTGQWRAARS